jgi:hypothetical protein
MMAKNFLIPKVTLKTKTIKRNIWYFQNMDFKFSMKLFEADRASLKACMYG